MRYVRWWIGILCASSLLLGQDTSAGTIKGKVTGKRTKDLPYSLVYVDSAVGEFKPPEQHALIDQKNLVFVPHVLPVLAGTTVDFRNSDEVAHNVFTPDESAGKFNLGTWPKGEIRSYTFGKRCEKICDAVMLCNVHPEMEAYVVIMQNPYFAMANDSGLFSIEGVPAGVYTLAVWHPKQKATSVKVEVPAEGAVEVQLTLQKK